MPQKNALRYSTWAPVPFSKATSSCNCVTEKEGRSTKNNGGRLIRRTFWGGATFWHVFCWGGEGKHKSSVLMAGQPTTLTYPLFRNQVFNSRPYGNQRPAISEGGNLRPVPPKTKIHGVSIDMSIKMFSDI